MYDYVIVGGGPTGLTLASYLPGRVAIFERHPVLGGCHRTLPSARFVEHGPRVYSGAYVNVVRMLERIGLSWDRIFQKVPFSPEHVDGKRWYQWLSPRESAWLAWDYLVYALLDGSHGKQLTMKRYCSQRGFSQASQKYVDRVCKFSDGAGADRYTLWEFVSGFDQHLRPFYVPRDTTKVLFETWDSYLRTRGVDMFTSSNVTRVSKNAIWTGNKRIEAKKVILCLPPLHAERLLRASGIVERGFREFAKKTKYDEYWSVSFYGDALKKNEAGQKSTEWDVVAVQYPFGVLSAAASSKTTGKPKEVAREIGRQLGLPPSTPFDYLKTKYNDQAFVLTPRGYWPAELKCGIASVGCHNGKSSYHFTSMESAVQNALAYLGEPTVTPAHASDLLRVGLLTTLLLLAARAGGS